MEKIILEESVKAVFGLLMLAVGWFVGNRITDRWDLKKKRRELDIASAAEFYRIYGEFKSVWRVYKVVTKADVGAPEFGFANKDETREKLLDRATAAEGAIEALILKLASERQLEEPEIRDLGLFRQAFQSLRQSMRDKKILAWGYKSTEYALFNELSSSVAHLIATGESVEKMDAKAAQLNLARIVAIRSEQWDAEIESRKPLQSIHTTA